MSLAEELPSPGKDRTGWPWVQELHEFPDRMPNGNAWPRISIITPSFNQGRFIEETVRSILLQNYPNLEYIIMDGGSTDETREILEKYNKWITYWESEKDNGQSDAINRGMAMASGDIVNWICSDDIVSERSFFKIANEYSNEPDAIAWVGASRFIDETGGLLSIGHPVVGSVKQFINWGGPGADSGVSAWVPQPSCYFRRDTFVKVGGLNPELYFTMDVDLWIKLAKLGAFKQVSDVLSSTRIYPGIKSAQDYPGAMTEHVVIGWAHGERELARAKLLEFGKRYSREHLLSLGFLEIAHLVLTWSYRALIKKPINWVATVLK